MDFKAKAEALFVRFNEHTAPGKEYGRASIVSLYELDLREAYAIGEENGRRKGIEDAAIYVESAGECMDWIKYYHDNPSALADDIRALLDKPEAGK